MRKLRKNKMTNKEPEDLMRPQINYTDINMTPYEFDKTLIETSEEDLFVRNEEGKVQSLNHEAYAKAAKSLLESIYGV